MSGLSLSLSLSLSRFLSLLRALADRILGPAANRVSSDSNTN